MSAIRFALVLLPLSGLIAPAGAGAGEAAVKAPLAVESLLLDGAAAGSRLVVVGERGHILISTDDGRELDASRGPDPRPAHRAAHARRAHRLGGRDTMR